jgi:serine/threonine protein kinase
VKKANVSDPKKLTELAKEVHFMKKLVSPYVVRYYGSYLKGNYMWVC